MRILIDTNLFLDVLLEREGLVDESQAVLDWCGSPPGDAWLAWHSLANLYYVGAKTVGKRLALEFMDEVLAVFEVCPSDTAAARAARTLSMADFEDALQAIAAQRAGATLIVTRNRKDYRHSPVPAATPAEFLSRYNLSQR